MIHANFDEFIKFYRTRFSFLRRDFIINAVGREYFTDISLLIVKREFVLRFELFSFVVTIKNTIVFDESISLHYIN